MVNFKDKLENLLKKEKDFLDENGVIDYIKIKDLADKIDSRLIELLITNNEIKKKFFSKIKDVYVFNINHFKFFLDENKVNNSYTQYKNRIGLSDGKEFINDRNDTVLDFPFKDCILEGGQSTEEGIDTYFEYSDKTEKYEEKTAKRNEVFFNQVLAHDEIDRLCDRKALVNWKRFTKDSKKDGEIVKEIKRDKKGLIQENLIIKGNNLLALHSLKSEFAGNIKLIYIDPPYNTKTDSFVYNDNFNHSTWLTFMKNRLELANELLRDDGILFVQCDDNEQSYLKVLMDEIFDRENFVGTLIHQRAKGGGNAKHIVKGHDYITIFAKKLSKNHKFIREKVIQAKVIEIDGVFYLRNDDVVRKVFGKYDTSLGDRRCFYEELEKYKNEKQIKEIKEKIKNKDYVLENFGNGMQVIVKYTPIEESYSKLYSIVKALSEDGNNEISELGLDFSNPKPEQIIKFLIEAVTKPTDIVLDYHLGSGTTCAVAHKMNRQYIGIEQMDYIETVAVERMKKVIKGEQGGISKSVDWKGGGEFIYCELAKWNEQAKEEIQNVKDLSAFVKLFDTLYKKYFLNYNVKIKDFKENIMKEENFKKLTLIQQKKMFLAMLDLNQMYVNESEMADKKYGISVEDQKLTNTFYSKK
ncbi:MAG: site-specific DNA-methyltransferase [bacterium]